MTRALQRLVVALGALLFLLPACSQATPSIVVAPAVTHTPAVAAVLASARDHDPPIILASSPGFGFGKFDLRHPVVGPVTPGIIGSPVVWDTRFGTFPAQTAIDGDFWFTPSGGVPIIWVNSGTGSDSNNCTSYTTPCGTLDGAFTKFATVAAATPGAHLRVAGDNTYTQSASGVSLCCMGGISATYPTVIESYDPADPTNAAKYGKLHGSHMPVIYITTGTRFTNAVCNGGGDYYAIVGLDLDSQDADSAGITWQCAPHTGIVFQNDRFVNIQLTFNGGVSYDATGATYMQNISVSKSSFIGGWSSGANMQSIYAVTTSHLWLQNNVFWHAGWRVGGTRDDPSSIGGANQVNHADYVNAVNNDTHIDDNLYGDTSADGLNLRGPGVITSNASVDEPIAGNVGEANGAVPNSVLITNDDWAILGSADINSAAPRGSGPYTSNTASGSHMRNIAAFDAPAFGLGRGYLVQSYNNGISGSIVSITHSGNVATLTLGGTDSYLTSTRQRISVDHAVPTDYNVADVPITVIDSTHVSYTMATTPASNATSVGVYSNLAPQYMLFDKVHSYNFANTLDSGINNPFQADDAINNTWTNAITDQIAPGTGNQVASGALLPGYKTRDQVITAVLTGIGITPGANYYIRKGQFFDAALANPGLPWARWTIGASFPAMGLTPTYTTPAYTTYTDTPLTIYNSTLSNLTPSVTSFTAGTSATSLLSGLSALPVLTSSDQPSGCSLAGRLETCNFASSGTYTFHVTENSQDGTATPHTTTLVFTAGGSGATLSSPTATAASSTTATLGVTTNTGSGTLYWEVCTTATTPTAAQVKLGQDSTGTTCTAHNSQAVSATGAQSATATGLTQFTTYYTYFVQNTGADSNVASAASFTGGLGPEIVVDGGFNTPASWSTSSGWSVSGGFAVGSSANFFLYQGNAGIVAGHTYRVTYTVSGYVSGGVTSYLGSTPTSGTSKLANGTYTDTITPTAGNELGLWANAGASGLFTGNVDNLSVREVLP